ncbi:hypothetical protein AB0A63_14020 [Lentzea sp. NPDC042327]|uniref:hypothetical protein n=1 Tax=Lentzea sp. NPDC042327 TaxID=3154801 RepID=UPI0033C57AFB
MGDGIIPPLKFDEALAERVTAAGDAIANTLGSSGPLRTPRALDLRRTEPPALGGMPAKQRGRQHRRRYAIVLLDSDGRVTDQQLFSQLGWSPGMRVDIGVGDGHEIVVRRDEDGDWALTARNMLLVPAPLRRWCGYESREPVLMVAVPSMAAVVLHNLETLDQALPDPRRIVERMRPPGTPPGIDPSMAVDPAVDPDDGELPSGPGSQVSKAVQDAAGSGDGRG